MVWEKVENEILKLDEENKEFVGTLVNIEDGSYGKIFVFQDENKKIVLLGQQTVLERKIRPRHVGKRIKIVYLGKEFSDKRQTNYNNYDVYVDNPEKKDEKVE